MSTTTIDLYFISFSYAKNIEKAVPLQLEHNLNDIYLVVRNVQLYSNEKTLNRGVPQGSVLGTRLYTLYNRPLSHILKNHRIP